MADRLALALAQINPVVGDLVGNIALIRSARQKAAGLGADLAVFPELALSGCPLDDLALQRDFLDHCRQALASLASDTADGGPALLVGLPLEIEKQRYNCAALLDGGRVTGICCKRQLPDDGMFDEKRLFAAGSPPEPLIFRGIRLGIMICQDMWTPDATECLRQAGAELLVVINASPFEADNSEKRRLVAAERVAQSQRPLVYVNQCGGQDELVFDGASFALNANGALACQLPDWRTDTALTVWQRDAGGRLACPLGSVTLPLQGHAAIYNAMVLALRDYVQKNRFPGVALGLSGGVDSALAAAIAVDALGCDKVWAVMMPSCHTSQESLEDAALVAQHLGIRLDVIAIAPAMQAFDAMLAPIVSRGEPGIMEENVQSRSRGLTLMAISNKFGPMALATGNKSEFSVGYATLYGDMCGGYAILKDVYKTTVFALSNWRNRNKPVGSLGPNGPVMPQRVIAKPPSAELKPNQTDQDALPPYDVLDGILTGLIEERASQADLIARGYDQTTVQQVWDMLARAEYKRRQAPPGVKITRRSFGRERRYPMTNRYRGSV